MQVGPGGGALADPWREIDEIPKGWWPRGGRP